MSSTKESLKRGGVGGLSQRPEWGSRSYYLYIFYLLLTLVSGLISLSLKDLKFT